jgi:hypothetical protein
MSATADVVVCTATFESNAGMAVRGRRYRSDDPVVVAAPGYFVPFETPEQEWGSEFDVVVAENERRAAEDFRGRVEQARNHRVKLSAPVHYRAKRDVLDVPGLRTVVKGSTVAADDVLLHQYRDDFEEVKT